MNPDIFREYDIRGIAETELTDEVAADIGRAYGTHMRRAGARTVAVGRDVRLSSPRLRDRFIEGVCSTGLCVLDVGVVPTPVLYFSIVHYGLDGGVSLTGSHNPIEYNGFKMCRGIASLYGQEIQRLRRLIEAGDFERGAGTVEEGGGGSSGAPEEGRGGSSGAPEGWAPIPAYMADLKRRIALDRRLKVAMDAGNGTAGLIAPALFRELGCQVVELYCEPDGRFPNHLPDPTVPRFMADLQRAVVEAGADVGIGYDGDADRIGAVDEGGRLIFGDRLLALYARDVLTRVPGAHILLDVKCSQGLVEDIQAHGGVPEMWKTGHSLIKAKMAEEGWPLGGEMSGHMFFAEGYYGYDDAIFASARLAQILSRADRTFSQLIDQIPAYITTPEIRVGCPDREKFAVVEAVKAHFQRTHRVIDVDGARVLFGDGWGLVRASNTQPVLVLRFEARTPERLEEIRRIITDRLREFPSVSLEEVGHG